MALMAIQVVLLVYWARSTHIKTSASVPNAAVQLVGVLAIALLSFIEHQKTIRPSLIIEAYLFVTILFDIARVRTLWLLHSTIVIAALTTVWVLLKFLLLCVEATGKQKILREEYRSTSPEALVGLCGKLFFWWLNPLFRTGFKRTLSIDDLLPLDKHLKSDYLYQRMQLAVRFLKGKGPNFLLKRYFSKLKWHLASVVPPRLGYTAFTFCQPFLIQRAIDFSQQSKSETPNNVGYGLIGAYLLVYCGIAVTSGQYQHLTYRSITMARGGLISSLLAKTSTLKADDVDPAASLTLMSADIERITNGWQTMHEIWAGMIEVALAIYLLARQLGVACVIPLGVAIGEFSLKLNKVSDFNARTRPPADVIDSILCGVYLRDESCRTKARPMAGSH